MMSPGLKPCRGCPALIEWRLNPNTGKRVPLDEIPRLMIEDPASREWAYDAETMATVKGRLLELNERPTAGGTVRKVWTSHFRTCPAANRFSGASRS